MPINKDALALVAKVNKAMGAGTVVLAAEMVVPRRFPSGSVSLDIALGGGWPGNQWVEVIGRESHGKTAVVLKTISVNQAADPDFTTLWIAAEHYDTDQATALGVDNERVIVIPTQAMEFAYQTMLEFAASRSVDAIVLDSYPALIPDEESGKNMDEAVMALGARLTGKFFRKAGTATARSLSGEERPILGIIINQYRDKIGAFSPHGTPQTTPGGNAKNFAFYTRVEVKKTETITEKRPGKPDPVAVGQVMKVKTIKNKAAAPQQVATIDFFFRDAPYLGYLRGQYDEVKEIVTMGVLFGVISRGGAYFSYRDTRWGGPGRKAKDDMVRQLWEDLDLRAQLTADVLEAAQHADERSLGEAEVEAAEQIAS